jgi:OOP family OmpA-OmpF porin
MQKLFKAFGAVVAAIVFLFTNQANAQDLTLRLEPGVAVPLTRPQSDRFDLGGALAVKPELTLGGIVGVGPSLSVVSFHSAVDGVDAPTLWAAGGFLRLKRPHDNTNTGTGFDAASPWVDADIQYVRTGSLDRLGWAVATGVQVPTSDACNLWVGPFVRYEDVYQSGVAGELNLTDSQTLILGLSVEVGAKTKPAPVVYHGDPPPVLQPVSPVVQEAPLEQPKPVPTEVAVEFKQSVQFPFDSSVLDANSLTALDAVVSKLTSSREFKALKVEGHASSDGSVKHNDALALSRAQSVADFLVAHGVPKNKVSVVGFGSRVPVASNKTEAGRVLNRRVEFVVSFTFLNEVK